MAEYQHIPYGFKVTYVWSDEDKARLAAGESVHDVFWYPSQHKKRQRALERAVSHFVSELTEAAWVAVQGDPSLITAEAHRWIVEQVNQWREHECDY